MDSFRGPLLKVTRHSTSYIKKIQGVEDAYFFITYGIMFRDFLCALTLDIMDTFCGCASQRKLTAKMSFTPAVEKAHSPTQSENRKRKIQPDRNRIRVFNEKR